LNAFSRTSENTTMHESSEIQEKPKRVSIDTLINDHLPEKEGKKRPVLPQVKQDNKRTKVGLKLLMIFPWLLFVGFFVSVFWDFTGIEITLFGFELTLQGLLRILTVSGLIGFATNWLAIQMLFYPRKKRPILGQGLIPAQKSRIAERLALAVDKDLVNIEHIKQRLTKEGQIQKLSRGTIRFVNSFVKNEAFRQELRLLLSDYIHQSLEDPEIKAKIRERAAVLIKESTDNSKLEKTALKFYLFVKGKTLDTLIDEALLQLPAKIEDALDPVDDLIDTLPARLFKEHQKLEEILLMVIERALENLDIYEIVKDNLDAYDELKLEAMIRNATNEHLNYIKYLGAAIGTIGGFIIWNPLSIFALFLLGFFVYLLDLVLDTTTKSTV
jgi:uncharacterized membrane protein YheB (UPF0754 family)